MLALAGVCGGTVGVVDGVSRIKRDRLGVGLDRVVVLLRAHEGVALRLQLVRLRLLLRRRGLLDLGLGRGVDAGPGLHEHIEDGLQRRRLDAELLLLRLIAWVDAKGLADALDWGGDT